MDRSVLRSIDLVIEKKLDSEKTINNRVKDLHNFSKFVASSKNEFHKYCFKYDDMLEKTGIVTRIDVYNNKFCNFYENKIKKTQCRFNLLKMFKPGELLTAVAGC